MLSSVGKCPLVPQRACIPHWKPKQTLIRSSCRNLGTWVLMFLCVCLFLFKDCWGLVERKMASVRDFCCLLRVPAGRCEKRKGESPGTRTKPDLTLHHLGQMGCLCWGQSRVAMPAPPGTAAGLLAAAAGKVALNKLSEKSVGANAVLLLCKGLWSIFVPLCFSSECLLSIFALVAPKYVQFRRKAVSSFLRWARGTVLLHVNSTFILRLWHFPSSLWSQIQCVLFLLRSWGWWGKGQRAGAREPGCGAAPAGVLTCWRLPDPAGWDHSTLWQTQESV